MAEYRYQLRGEVDRAVADKIRNDLQVVVLASDAHLLVDCAKLEFIDSTGIAVLLETNRDLEEQGRHMLLVNVPTKARRVFEILDLMDFCRYDRGTASLAAEPHP